MKKKLLIILLLCVFVLPLTVSADRDLDGEIKIYSEETSVGSTLVFKYRAVCGNECDEMLVYDSNVLEYLSVEASFTNWEAGSIATPSINVTSNEPGKLKYDYTVTKNEDYNGEFYSTSTEILVKFKVLSIPDDGIIKVEATALDNDGNPIEGLKNNLEIMAISTSSESSGCPECEQKKEEKSNDSWFLIGIISLIFNGLLLILVVLLLIKSKSKPNNISNNDIKDITEKTD